MIKIKVVEDYGTHECHDEYTHVPEIHCPSCGFTSVWESKEGDYYEGLNYLCSACLCQFTMPTFKQAEGVYLDVIKQIKIGYMNDGT